MPSYNELVEQLSEINESIVSLTNEIASQSFWGSQLFAAIIGAGTATLVYIIPQIIKYIRKRVKRHVAFCKWLTENYIFYRPESLLREAKKMHYDGTTVNTITGQKVVTQDKPLGEKMMIELRKGTKYWRNSSLKIKRKFNKYEKEILKFNKCNLQNRKELLEYFERADAIYEEIKDMAFKRMGENEWTV